MEAPPSPLAGRRALVLGASGFLGRWTSAELLDRGARAILQVRERSRLPSGLAARGAEIAQADLAPAGAIGALVREVRPDVVFSLAGYGVAKDERDEGRMRRINSALVAELVAALSGAPSDWPGQRLVHVGSALEAGTRPSSLDESAIDASAPGAPDTAYGRSKLEATRRIAAARAGGLAALVARPFTVFGLGERPGRLVPSLLAARATPGPIALSSGEQSRDWVYVEDVARALVELALLPAARTLAGRYPFDAGALNLASGALTPVREFVLALAEVFSIATERLRFGALAPLAEETFHPPVPVARLGRALGWTPPRDPREGLARLFARAREEETAR